MSPEIQHLKNVPSVIIYSGLFKDELKMNFFSSLDVAIEGQMHENELTSTVEEPEFEYVKPPRLKQAGEEVPLEMMTKAVEALPLEKIN